jgi:hypothetical protein
MATIAQSCIEYPLLAKAAMPADIGFVGKVPILLQKSVAGIFGQ